MKILVIQQKMIGDVLASTLICNTLRTVYTNSTIDYLIYPFTAAVVENNPNINSIVFFKEEYRSDRKAFLKFLMTIRKEKYDIVIDAYSKIESGLISLLSGAGKRVGVRKWYTRLLYTKTVITDKKIEGSALHHRMQLVEAITNQTHPISFPEIFFKENEIINAKKIIESKLDVSIPIIMISVLGTDATKSLPAIEMAKVLDKIANTGNTQLLFNYLPKQEAEAKKIYDLCAQATQQKIVFNFYSKSLREFITILTQCQALIGNEGGAVNMAKAVGVPTFTIFSPWINKNSWNMLTENENHVAVHLQDYFPEIYGDIHPKEFKKQALELYPKLKLELFENELEQFIKRSI